MRIETLPAPGYLSNGITLRREAAKAISVIEIVAGRTPGGKTTNAKTLSDFFTACVTALSALYDVTAPTMAGATGTAVSPTSITLVFAENMDTSVLPASTAFTVNNGGVVSSIVWTNATTLTITGTGFAAADVVTYTKPATNMIRDLPGNQMATGNNTVV